MNKYGETGVGYAGLGGNGAGGAEIAGQTLREMGGKTHHYRQSQTIWNRYQQCTITLVTHPILLLTDNVEWSLVIARKKGKGKCTCALTTTTKIKKQKIGIGNYFYYYFSWFKVKLHARTSSWREYFISPLCIQWFFRGSLGIWLFCLLLLG